MTYEQEDRTLTRCDSHSSSQALFGGQLSGRQYKGVKLNPLFLECTANDGVSLDIRTRSLGRLDNSVRIDLHGSVVANGGETRKVRRSSTSEVNSYDQQDSGVSSDISSGDSQVEREGSPVVHRVEQNENGEIVLTLNRRPNSVHGTTSKNSESSEINFTRLRSANSFRIEKDFGLENKGFINDRCRSFDADQGTIENDYGYANHTLNGHGQRKTFNRNDVNLSYDNEICDEDSEDHYQTIDAVIIPDPNISDSKSDIDSNSDNSDDISQLYARVKKGPNSEDVLSSVAPLFTSTIIVNNIDNGATNTTFVHGDLDAMDPENNFNSLKPTACRSMSNTATDSSRKHDVLVRAHSETSDWPDADDLNLPDYWNPNKIGKRRNKSRMDSKHNDSADSSSGKELKSILVSTLSRTTEDRPTSSPQMNQEFTPIAPHNYLTEQKSVKFSDDTVDNEHKTKHYRQEVIDFCELHRLHENPPNNGYRTHIHTEDVEFDGSYPWPATPRDNYMADNICQNNNINGENGTQNQLDVIGVCPKCCAYYNNAELNSSQRNKSSSSNHVTSLDSINIEEGRVSTTNGHMCANCLEGNASPRVECQRCLAEQRKIHLERRQSIMKWSLASVFVLALLALIIGLSVHFTSRSTT